MQAPDILSLLFKKKVYYELKNNIIKEKLCPQ